MVVLILVEVDYRLNNHPIPVVVVSGVSHHHFSKKLKAFKTAFLSKDQMTTAAFQSAISVALALLDLNLTNFF